MFAIRPLMFAIPCQSRVQHIGCPSTVPCSCFYPPRLSCYKITSHGDGGKRPAVLCNPIFISAINGFLSFIAEMRWDSLNCTWHPYCAQAGSPISLFLPPKLGWVLGQKFDLSKKSLIMLNSYFYSNLLLNSTLINNERKDGKEGLRKMNMGLGLLKFGWEKRKTLKWRGKWVKC